jgi:hypothetical protein
MTRATDLVDAIFVGYWCFLSLWVVNVVGWGDTAGELCRAYK